MIVDCRIHNIVKTFRTVLICQYKILIFYFLENKVGTPKKAQIEHKKSGSVWFLIYHSLGQVGIFESIFFVFGLLLNFFLLFTNTCFSIAITIHLEMAEIMFEDHGFYVNSNLQF